MKATASPAVTNRCERWSIKKAECRRIDAFGLRCWRRLLRVPWTARRPNPSILCFKTQLKHHLLYSAPKFLRAGYLLDEA